WVLARDSDPPDSEPEAFPADGALCGLLARRALERGAWGSILGVPIDCALGLGPPPYRRGEFVSLFAAGPPRPRRPGVGQRQVLGVNVLARGARGFGPVGERTAWPDPVPGTLGDSPESVPLRRFMALLRRELFRVEADLAFLPNGPALERRATRAVESL